MRPRFAASLTFWFSYVLVTPNAADLRRIGQVKALLRGECGALLFHNFCTVYTDMAVAGRARHAQIRARSRGRKGIRALGPNQGPKILWNRVPNQGPKTL